jgi:hypothetical protein
MKSTADTAAHEYEYEVMKCKHGLLIMNDR